MPENGHSNGSQERGGEKGHFWTKSFSYLVWTWLNHSGWLRSWTGTVGTVFPETERGTGTAGTVFHEPKPEPSFPVKLYRNTEKLFLQRNRRNRKPEENPSPQPFPELFLERCAAVRPRRRAPPMFLVVFPPRNAPSFFPWSLRQPTWTKENLKNIMVKDLNLKIGACAMTTKFLDYIICTFKILLSWHFPLFWDDFPFCPPLWKPHILFILSSRCLWKEAKTHKKRKTKEIPRKKNGDGPLWDPYLGCFWHLVYPLFRWPLVYIRGECYFCCWKHKSWRQGNYTNNTEMSCFVSDFGPIT